jgi:glutamine cyclotransferase
MSDSDAIYSSKLLLLALLVLFICNSCSETNTTDGVSFSTFRIVNSFPHDKEAFTEGLAFAEDELFEGTGLRGRSSLRKVDLHTGEILQIIELPSQFFGEGVTVFENRIIQLTLQSNLGFVYDKDSLELIQEFGYGTEGWGITNDRRRLIMSDGTSTIYFLDPESFEEIGRIEVFDENGTVTRLNELEYINGRIFANVWLTDFIAVISPDTGQVVGWIDLSGLLGPGDLDDPNNPDAVLNGIAYDEKNDRLFVTGKLWPKIFEIKLVTADR